MSRLLPRYTISSHADQLKVDKIIGTSTASEVTVHPKATAPGDTRRLRGIPVAGGACGTSPGTDPLAAVIAKEQRKKAA